MAKVIYYAARRDQHDKISLCVRHVQKYNATAERARESGRVLGCWTLHVVGERRRVCTSEHAVIASCQARTRERRDTT